MTDQPPTSLSIIVPSFQRTETCRHSLERIKEKLPSTLQVQVIVIEQGSHSLEEFSQDHDFDYGYLAKANLVAARNLGLKMAINEVVVFLDDDIIPQSGLFEAHIAEYRNSKVGAVAGRVKEKGTVTYVPNVSKVGDSLEHHWNISFDHDIPMFYATARGCNMSFRREALLAIGGFSFKYRPPQSYREDTDACFRIRGAGYLISYCPRACVEHLALPSGGTRSLGGGRLQAYKSFFHHCRDNATFVYSHFDRQSRRRLFGHYRKTFRGRVRLSGALHYGVFLFARFCGAVLSRLHA